LTTEPITGPDHLVPGDCLDWREGFSASLDGEAVRPVPHCDACTRWVDRVGNIQDRLGSLAAEPGADLTQRLVGAITASGPPHRPRDWRFTAGAAVAAAVLAAALVAGANALAGNHRPPAAQVRQISGPTGQNPNYPGLVQSPRAYAVPEVTLTDTTGAAYDLVARSQGRITLVYFGYTHCPDVCPTDMALNAEALSQLPASVARDVQVVFVTTDPNRDSGAVMRSWLNRFDPSFIGLTGTMADIHQAESTVGMPLSYQTPDSSGDDADSGGYAVLHASYTMIYTPDAKSHLFYADTARPSDVAAALEKLAAHGFQT
jgi:protein SCO1